MKTKPLIGSTWKDSKGRTAIGETYTEDATHAAS